MTSQESSYPHQVRFYIPGDLPSARELANLLLILEGTLFWGLLVHSIAQHQETQKRYGSLLGGEEKRETKRRLDELNATLAPIFESYELFLMGRYEGLFKDINVSDVPFSLSRELERIEYRSMKRDVLGNQPIEVHLNFYGPDTRESLHRIVTSRGFNGSDFSFNEFSDWMGETIGSKGMKTISIDQTGSIEFLYDASTILAYLFLQPFPAVKDSVTYTLSLLKQWTGNGSRLKNIRTPELGKDMMKLMAQYDDVELKIKNDEFAIRLIRKSA